MTLVGALDPNWKTDQGGGGKGANEHYELASVEEMAWNYRKSPPWNDVGPGLLFMWATTLALCSNGRSAPHQLALALDFRICASWIWWKCDDLTDDVVWAVENGESVGGLSHYQRRQRVLDAERRGIYTHPVKPSIGLYESCEHEFLFLCRRGDFDLEQYDAIRKVRDRSVICAPRGEHSEKPEKAFTQTIEPVLGAAFPNVKPIEWNSRKRRPRWSAYGRLNGEFLPDGVTPAPLVYEIGAD